MRTYHENNFETTVTSAVSAAATTTPLDDIPTVSTPYYLIFDPDNSESHYEEVLVTSATATNVNHAALTYAHGAAETVRMAPAASDLDILTEQASTGWIGAGDAETWTYASDDDPTYTFTITGDKTSKYSAGMRIKLTQPTDGVKYGIITKVAYSSPNTTITIYMGTDYDLDNEAITSPYYSTNKAPHGFPLDPIKWTEEASETSSNGQTNPTQNTWYNVGTVSLEVPIGVWKLSYSVCITVVGGSNPQIRATLSTANNSQSDANMTGGSHTIGDSNQDGFAVYREKHLNISSKASYYLNIMTPTGSVTNIYKRGDIGATVIRVVCAYL